MPPSGRSRIPHETATPHHVQAGHERAALVDGREAGDGRIQRHRSEEDAERLGQRRDGVVRGERAQRRQQKSPTCGARSDTVRRARSAMKKQSATSMTICTSSTAL